MHRRKFLAVSTTATTGIFAGCATPGGGDEGEDDEDEDGGSEGDEGEDGEDESDMSSPNQLR